MDPDCDLVIPLPLRPNPRWANSSTLQWWRLWPWHRSRGRSATNTCHFVPYAMRCFTSARWNNPKRFHKQNQYWVLLPWYNQHQPTPLGITQYAQTILKVYYSIQCVDEWPLAALAVHTASSGESRSPRWVGTGGFTAWPPFLVREKRRHRLGTNNIQLGNRRYKDTDRCVWK